MAINLYRKGNSHEVRGIDCEIVRCEISQMEDFLSAGCVKSPEDLLNKKEAAAVDKANSIAELNKEMDKEFL